MVENSELRRRDSGDAGPLTKREKVIGLCLLAIYVAMIAVTIATLPYLSNDGAQHVERAHDSF